MRTGFAVLNYGPADMALRACRSIAEGAAGASLVLVDNFSTEENRRQARQGLEALERETGGAFFFLGLPDNLGYGSGMNAGLRFLFAKLPLDLVFAVNSDIELRQFDLGRGEDPGAQDALYCVTLREGGRTRIGASRFVPWCFVRCPVHGPRGLDRGPVYAEGSFWGMTRTLFERTGGFAEDYFLYFEELDFVYRYRSLHGHFPKIVHLSGVVAEHRHGGSTGMAPGSGRSTLAEYWSARSRVVFARRWTGPFLCSAMMYNALLALRDLAWGRRDLAQAVWEGSRDALRGAGGVAR